MNCPRIRPMLSAFQDGELAPCRREEVERHLRACPACGAELENLREVERRLRLLPPPALDPFFPARVMAGLPAPRPRRVRLLQAAAWAAVFLAAFSGGFFLMSGAAARVEGERLQAATYSSVLLEPQELGLLAVHEQTLELFSGASHE